MEVGVAEGAAVLVGLLTLVLLGVGVAGGMPKFCSMQYELPTVRSQPAAWLGFCGS